MIAASWLVVFALAAPAVPEVTLPAEIGRNDVLELVRAHSPGLAVRRSEIDIVRADETQAALLPNPELRYIGYGRTKGTPEAINAQQHQLELALPLLVAGQRRTRRAAAQAYTRAAGADACVTAHALAGDALGGYVALLAGQQRLDILEQGERALAAAEELTRARASLGAQTQYDVLRVGAERESFAVQLSDARSATVDASARLAQAIGAPSWRPRATGTLADDEPDVPAFAVLWRKQGKYLPSMISAQRIQEAARRDRLAARRERWPIPTVSIGAYLTTDGTSSSVVASLQLPLPVFDRGQGALARTAAVERTAALRRDQTELVAATELQRALDVLTVRRESLRSFRRSALTRAPELRKSAQEAYRGGVASVLELLDAERAWLDVQLRWIDLLERLALAELDVALASGALGRELCS